MEKKADIGVFGGSGFYTFLPDVEEVWVETPYGAPSDRIALANVEGKRVAFLPRHGKDHRLPPHQINYRANLYAMKQLGVSRILAPTAAGSLQPHIKPGDFVISDQLVDRTNSRKDTFYDGPITTHISLADPYCPDLRNLAYQCAVDLGISVHPKGTVVVIQGPRFSTRAESRWFSSLGWEVINMTQYPECPLARELNICYTNIALITDYDAGLEGNPDIRPVTHAEVIEVFNQNTEKIKSLLYRIIREMDIHAPRECVCATALESGRM